MDIEQLKLILEALNGTTELAAGLFLVWLLAQLVPQFLIASVICFLIITARKIFTVASGSIATITQVRDYICPRHAGTCLSDREIFSIARALSDPEVRDLIISKIK